MCNHLDHNSIIDIIKEENQNIKYKKNMTRNKLKTIDFMDNILHIHPTKCNNCTRSPRSSIERHNYEIINKKKIICINCDKILKNMFLDHSRAVLKKAELMKLYRNAIQELGRERKKPIIIYRIRLLKESINAKYLPIPSKSYIGQTKKLLKERWDGHLTDSFNKIEINRRNDIFHRALRKYGISRNIAKNLFKLELWQVCFDQNEADLAEQFWIGWFKSQFIQFGWNILPGGQINHTTTEIYIHPMDLDKAIKDSLLIPKRDSPLSYLAKKFGISKITLNRKIKEFYKKPNEKGMTYWEIRKIYLKPLLDLYIRQGFTKAQIGPKLGLAGDPQDTISSYIEEFYGKRTKFSNLRKKYIKQGLKSLISFGYTTYKEISNQLPGMSNRTVRSFITLFWKGIKKAEREFFKRPRAIQFFNMGYNGLEICCKLGYSEHYSYQHYRKILANLFKGVYI